MTARGYRMAPDAKPCAGLFPPELTAIRAGGLVLAVLIAGYAIWRRRELRNADVLILLAVALGLAIVAGTEIPDALLSAFSFERENGTRIVGVAIFAILDPLPARPAGAEPGLADHARALGGARGPRLGAVPRRRPPGAASATGSAILVPAYNEADNVGAVLDRIPAEVCGVADRGARRRRRLARRHRGRRRAPTARSSPAT